MARKKNVMFTFNNKNYKDFTEFANTFANVFDHVDFAQATTISKQVDSITSDDVNASGVYEINGKKFAISQTFDGIETTSKGNENKRKRRLVKFENSNEIKRFDDITQLKRILGAATGQNPSGIKCGKSRKISVNSITIENAETIQAQAIAQVKAIEDVLTFAGLNVEDVINNITTNINAKVDTLKAEQAKAENLKKLSGLTPDQIEKLMALI
jgi:hypothetical protein